MKIMFLDDDLHRYRIYRSLLDLDIQIDWAQTVSEAIDYLKQNQYDLISLDHDLGGLQMVESSEDTGWVVAKWISENMKTQPTIHIHTLNPGGAQNMLALLPNANIIPFTQLIQQLR